MKIQGIPALLAISLSITVMSTGCFKKEVPQKPEKAAASSPAPVAKAAPKVKKAPEPVWPEKLPEGWVLINDYEKPADLKEPEKTEKKAKGKKKRKVRKPGPANLLGGEWGKVGFNGGLCKLAQTKDGDNTVLQITYSMPSETSECGTYEYLKPFVAKKVKRKLIKNYPQYFDLRPYKSITALVKSGDEKEHNLKLHLTELDPYGSQLQGYVSPTRMIVAGKDWKRVEFTLDDTLHDFFDRSHAQATGIRIRFQEQNDRNDAGVILIDNIALIKKTGD